MFDKQVLGINLLVFHRAPKTLDEDVVDGAALVIHADADLVRVEYAGIGLTAGADLLAVMPAIFSAPNIEQATQEFIAGYAL